MTYFKNMMLAGAVAVSGAVVASEADAFFVSGTFEVTAYSYQVAGSTGTISGDRGVNSQASENNFKNISGVFGAPTIGTVIGFDTFEYTGDLKFRIGGTPGGSETTIAEFIGSGGGSIGSGSDDLELDSTFGELTNSAGEGGGDGGISTPFFITTIYKITAKSFSNIASLAQLTFVKHDDGITIQGSGGTSVASVGPNSEKMTSAVGLTGGAGDFVLYYASANGDPSILEVNAVPLPAAAWLLLGVAGTLVAAKRRSSLRAA